MNNELIEEALDKRDKDLKHYIDQRIVEALIKQRPQQQRPDLFWKEIKNIFSEEKPDTSQRLMLFLASYARDNNIQGGEQIYAHAYNVYQRYN